MKAKFLTLLNGRGALYVFIGTLLMAQWPGLLHLLERLPLVWCHLFPSVWVLPMLLRFRTVHGGSLHGGAWVGYVHRRVPLQNQA
jgi:hypothetical protein